MVHTLLKSSNVEVYRDRTDAGRRLATFLKDRNMNNPVVLAIPRGGLPVARVIAAELWAELDVVLVRKLRAPWNPEVALGAVSEGGKYYVNHVETSEISEDELESYLDLEKKFQLSELELQQKLFRAVRPKASLRNRTVIVVDDGIDTDSTFLAALRLVRSDQPAELLAAAPVGKPDQVSALKRYCDEIICPLQTSLLRSVGEYYKDFEHTEDGEAVSILDEFYKLRHQLKR